MTLWRIHIRPYGGGATPLVSWQVCSTQNVLGVGWRVDWPVGTGRTPETYFQLGEQTYPDDRGWENNLTRLICGVQENDLIWTRDHLAQYYLARACGPWEYRDSPQNLEADVVNVRPVEMFKVGLADAVPGTIIANFRARRTLQRVHNPTCADFSARLFNELAQREAYPVHGGPFDVWSLLDDLDIENVAYAYLQSAGFVVFPTRRQPDTMRYEFECAHREDGHRAVVSVKSGNVPLVPAEFAEYGCNVFLFSASENYPGGRPLNVNCLSRQELSDFMRRSRHMLPGSVTAWMRYTGMCD